MADLVSPQEVLRDRRRPARHARRPVTWGRLGAATLAAFLIGLLSVALGHAWTLI